MPRDDSHLPKALRGLRIPLIASPLFIISVPKLVIAQCKAGIIGSFPALNAREGEGEHPLLDTWLTEIKEELDRHNQANPDTPAAPYAVNQIVHRSNARLERDLEICVKHEVPVWITSLGARVEVNEAAHSCGGIVLHDIINYKFAQKAVEKGADGLPVRGATQASNRPSPWSVKSVNGMTAPSRSRVQSPRARRCLPRALLGQTSAIQARPLLPQTRRTPIRLTRT